ncbi:MAG: FAD-dependent oxidoreductase [Candidatus Omnitrophica bacterium]|nr:FAD-dependent oxidoreductase [Candidatus Omnitrophota bacterium]
MTTAIVVGGGPAGCAAAYYLKQKGLSDVTIIENSEVGGCARTRSYQGIPYEFGPQIMFTDKEHLRKIFETWLTQHKPPSPDGEYHYVVSVEGTIDDVHDFPITVKNILKLPNPEQAIWELYQIDPDKPDYTNFERYAVSRVGQTLYETYIKNYNRKAWQMDPREMDTDWVNFRPLTLKRVNSRFSGQWQGHPGDYNPMWRAMTQGVKVERGKARFDDELRCYINGSPLKADVMVSTIPISEELEFINTCLVFVAVKCDHFCMPACFTTFPNTYDFVRILEYKQQFFVESETSLLSFDFPWRRQCPLDKFVEEALWFCRNILKREPVEHWVDNRERIYPLATRKNLQLFQHKLEQTRHSNVIPIGRAGMHAYCSKDTAIRMGLETAQHLEELIHPEKKVNRLLEMRKDLH